MKTYYKATAMTGLDFYSGTIDYATAIGGRVRAPSSPRKRGDGFYRCCTEGVLHASDAPSETLVGGSWPCRLFEVSGRPVASEGHKYGFRSLAVVREVESWRALGPNGREVAALIDQAGRLTADKATRLAAARVAARVAARAAARDAARDAACHAARDAAWALVVRDLISDEHCNILYGPWASVFGEAA